MTLARGESTQRVAVLLDEFGAHITGHDVKWTSSHPNIVSVTADGLVKRVAATSPTDNVIITAIAGNERATAEVALGIRWTGTIKTADGKPASESLLRIFLDRAGSYNVRPADDGTFQLTIPPDSSYKLWISYDDSLFGGWVSVKEFLVLLRDTGLRALEFPRLGFCFVSWMVACTGCLCVDRCHG